MRIRPVQTLPANFAEYIHDVAEGMNELYGEAAGLAYRRIAAKAVEASMRSPGVTTFCAETDGSCAGMAMAFHRDGLGRLPFIHVLRPYWGTGIEGRLVGEAVRKLKRDGAAAIHCECIPFCELDLRGAFKKLGFAVFPRQLMRVDTEFLSNIGTTVSRSAPCGPLDLRAAATTIAETYERHPERALHPELRDALSVEKYMRDTMQGAFGQCYPEFVRVLRSHDGVRGAILGCGVAPGVGFVLQVAVRPDAQNQGLGRLLIADLASSFLKRGWKYTALGVTVENPARKLYLRLGFEPRRDVDAFVWPPSPNRAPSCP